MVLRGFLVFFFSLLSLVYKRFHILSILLRLEIVILRLLIIIVGIFYIELVRILVFYLVIVVREAGLGLRVIVLGVYFYKRDLISRIRVLSW